MAGCYYHGQSGPGACPKCIEGGADVRRGGVRVTPSDARKTNEENIKYLHDDDPRKKSLKKKKKK